MPRRIEGNCVFPSKLRCAAEALGAEIDLEIEGVAGKLALPIRPSAQGNDRIVDLSPPSSSSKELLRRFHFPGWGYIGGQTAGLYASVILFDLSDDLSDDEVKTIAEGIGKAFDNWFSLFWEWIEALVGEIFDDPSASIKKHQIQLRGWFDGEYSQANIPSINTASRIGAKRASLDVLHTASRLASQSCDVPLEHRLLSDARRAFWQGDHRRAVLDAATAAELAITDATDRELQRYQLPREAQATIAKSFRSLGGKRILAKAFGLPLPDGLTSELKNPRDKAIHGGITVTKETAKDAVSTAYELINTFSPLHSYLTT